MNNSLDVTKDISVANHIVSKLDIFFFNQVYYKYQDNYWQPIEKDDVREIILDILKEKFSQGRVNNIMDIIRLSVRKSIKDLNLHTCKGIICFRNGLYSINENILYPHTKETKEYYITNQFPVNFKPNSYCSRWELFVEQIFEFDSDKKDKILLLQEYLGLCLSTITTFQRALLMLGSGANGKSIILSILEKILGEKNHSTIELNQLSNKNYIVDLQNKLVNFCSEIDFKGSFSTDIFKRVVTSETLTGDAKFKDPIKFRPYCKLIFATNGLPVTNDTSKGYFRRLLILKFNRSFEGSKRDPILLEKLDSELDGILVWIIDGLKRLIRNGKFTIPTSSDFEVDQYLVISNSVVAFVREKCELNTLDGHYESYKQLYYEYKQYCSDSGSRPFKQLHFRDELLKHYKGKVMFNKTGSRGWHFTGIRVLNDEI